jgi:hypothetical protein
MKIEAKELFAAFPHFAKNPTLAVAIFALVVPVVLLFGAKEFANASIEALVFLRLRIRLGSSPSSKEVKMKRQSNSPNNWFNPDQPKQCGFERSESRIA